MNGFSKVVLPLLIFLAVLTAAFPAAAHSVVIFPGASFEEAIAAEHDDFLFDVGETGRFVILGGHHFEYDWFGVEPLDVKMKKPDGTVATLSQKNATADYTHPASKERSTLTYQIAEATFDQAGIYTIYATQVDENGNTDSPKLMVYVGSDDTWTGWNTVIGLPAEVIPYTRTMNMRSGDVLSARFVADGKAVPEYTMVFSEPSRTAQTAADSFDEIVREFPTTEESIYLIYSKATSTNAAGDFMTTVDEPGLWVTVARTTNAKGLQDATTLIFPVMKNHGTFGPSAASDSSSADANGATPSTPGFTALAFAGAAGLAGFAAYMGRRNKNN